MSKSKLKIIGPYPAWSEAVREATLTAGGRTARVLIEVQERVPATQATLAVLQENARCLAAVHNSGLLRLLHVSSLKGKAALVYKGFDGLSVARVLDVQRQRQGFLPVKICVEFLGAIATAIAGCQATLAERQPERCLAHRGPTPDDVLIDTSGRVKLAGLQVMAQGDAPSLPLAGYTAPEEGHSEAALVYGLAAFCFEVFTGRRLPAGNSDGARHSAMVRSALGIMADRPGEAVPEDLLDLLRISLGKTPGARPSLAHFASQARALAEELRGPGLRAWAGAAVPGMLGSYTGRQRVRAAPPPPLSSPVSQMLEAVALPRRPQDTDEVPTVVESDEQSQQLRKQALEEARAPARPGHYDEVGPSFAMDTDTDATVVERGPSATIYPMDDDDEPEAQVGASPMSGREGPRVVLGAPPPDDPYTPPPPPPGKGGGLLRAALILVLLAVLGGVGVVVGAWYALQEGLIQELPFELPADFAIPGTTSTEEPPEALQPDGPLDLGDGDAVERPPAEGPEGQEPVTAPSEAAAPRPAEIPAPAPDARPVAAPRPSPAPGPTTAAPKPPPVEEPAPDEGIDARLGPGAAPGPDEEAAWGGEEPVVDATTFTVLFQAADPAVTSLQVKCHRGTSSGGGPVTVREAEVGPCRVIGKTADGSLTAFVNVDGARTWTCFGGGSSDCI